MAESDGKMNISSSFDGEFGLYKKVSEIEKNYENLENKPSINGVELLGNKTGEELGLVPDLSGYATKEELPVVPSALPNPNALTFTGAVNATYDGSSAVSVEIPSGGGEDVLELIASGKTDETGISTLEISADKDGNEFALKKGVLKYRMVYETGIPNFRSLSINGVDKSGFFNCSPTQSNIVDYYIFPLVPTDTFKPYGNNNLTVTVDNTNYGSEVTIQIEFELDENKRLNLTSYTEIYLFDSNGIKYPVFNQSGGATTFQINNFKQRERIGSTGNIIDFSEGVKSIIIVFNYDSGKNIEYELRGERL